MTATWNSPVWGYKLTGKVTSKKPPPPKPQRGVAGQHLQITGSLTNGTTFRSHTIVVLAGDDAPTITGGFAKWGVIDRPQRVGMTILQGYDPVILTVALRFDCAVFGSGSTGAQIERDIQILEWMGGRGKLYASDGKAFTPAQGDSPLISIFSADGQGNQTPLIPPNCQDINYVVSGISYDTQPWRNIHGERMRQDATLTLTQHVSAPGTSFDSASTQAKARKTTQGQYVYFTITKALDTVAKIMSLHYHDAKHDDWVQVVKDNKANKSLKLAGSVHEPLPVGKKLKVRKSFASHL